MSAVLNPHDRYFKKIFARPEIASEFLTSFLPESTLACLDLSTLSLQKDTFVDPGLREHFSDMLYQVETVEEESSYVYLLFEHKSYPDPLTIFQMLRYCVRIWEQALRADRTLTRLPPILPLLVYHGEQAWNAPEDMVDLLAGDEALHIYGPRFSCRLVDLSSWNADDIRESVLQVALQAMKNVRDPRLGREMLPQLLKLLIELTLGESAVEYIQALLVYLSAASPHLTEEEVRQAIQETLSDEGGRLMPTLAEKWYEQGFEKGVKQGVEQGIEQGLEQGLEQGRKQEAVRTIVGLLEHRFGPVDAELLAQFNRLTVDQMQSLSLFVLDAESIDQVADQARRLCN